MRWVDQEFEAHEEFLGHYHLVSTSAKSLMAMIHDVMPWFNLPFSKVQLQCCDGASSMSGVWTGVATQIMKEEPKVVFIHCYGYSLNLACSDTIKQCKVMHDALDVTYEITKLIKKSPGRDAILTKINSFLEYTICALHDELLKPNHWKAF